MRSGQAVAAGDRLRLAISTTYWPWLWPSPDEVEITVVAGDASWLDLPVRLDRGRRCVHRPTSGRPDRRRGLPIEELEASAPFRTLEHDVQTRTYTLTIDPEGDHRYRLPDGLEITERTRDHFTIREEDPLSATGRMRPAPGPRTWSMEDRGSNEERDDERPAIFPSGRHGRGIRGHGPRLRADVGTLGPPRSRVDLRDRRSPGAGDPPIHSEPGSPCSEGLRTREGSVPGRRDRWRHRRLQRALPPHAARHDRRRADRARGADGGLHAGTPRAASTR